MEEKEILYENYIKRLKKYNAYSEVFIKEYGDKLKIMPYALVKYRFEGKKGSLLDIVQNILCKNAFELWSLEQYKHLDISSIMKVLLLQNIFKVEMFAEVTDEAKINDGTIFEFSNKRSTKLNGIELTLFLCNKYNIKLTEEEVEALLVNSKNKDENMFYMSDLAIFIKVVNDLSLIDIKRKK